MAGCCHDTSFLQSELRIAEKLLRVILFEIDDIGKVGEKLSSLPSGNIELVVCGNLVICAEHDMRCFPEEIIC